MKIYIVFANIQQNFGDGFESRHLAFMLLRNSMYCHFSRVSAMCIILKVH